MRYPFILLLFVFVVGPFSLIADPKIFGGFAYEVENGEANIVAISSALEGTVSIPAEFDGIPVTMIDDSGLRRSNVTKIILPASVVDMGILVFAECDQLLEIEIKESNPAFTSVDGVVLTKLGLNFFIFLLQKIPVVSIRFRMASHP